MRPLPDRWAAVCAAAALAALACVAEPASATPRAGAGASGTPAAAGRAGDTEAAGTVLRVRIDGAITAVAADYAERAVREAGRPGVAALLVELDTPGGDTGSLGRIATAMLNSSVPVVVWVGPAGARAASAGTFVVLAGHASGMAERTTIGAASPVDASGGDLPSTMQRKATEDLAASARSLGGRRSAEAAAWAESAVRDAAAATAREALDLGIIDVVADDPTALLDALDGREVTVLGEATVLRTAGADVLDLPMTLSEGLLTRMVQPAIALLLLTLGLNAILIELSHPGGSVAGIVGVVALALALYSLGVLEANLTGLAFLAAAFAAFVLEVKASSHGLLAAVGIALFVIGSAVLYGGTAFGVPWVGIGALAVASAVGIGFVVRAARRALRRQPTTGAEGLVGAVGRVVRDLEPEGRVAVAGELWWAAAADGGSIRRGARVRVIAVHGLQLTVLPAD